MAKPQQNVRAVTARVLVNVIQQRRSLNSVLASALLEVNEKDRGLCQQLSYGVLRWQPTLVALAAQLLKKAFKAKDKDIEALLLIGLYQLRSMRTPAHAAISETVNAAKQLKKSWATGLLNACLREYQRNADELEATISSDLTAQYAHPDWLIQRYQQDWPEQWQQICEANNQQPPMMLRVNQLKTSVTEYLAVLAEHHIEACALETVSTGILLETPQDVFSLPGFSEGRVSVQDGSAQAAALMMDIQPGQRILDACAAPGGKTCHILEQAAGNEVVAIDVDAERLKQIEQNTARLGLNSTLLAADAADTEAWWDGQLFDRILLDAPCTGSGVIRRHPDIKVLRQSEDIDALAEKQQRLLEKLWPLLKPGGIMVYTTCSVFKQENELQIAHFLKQHPEATELTCDPAPATRRPHGYQRLAGDDKMDGFFYACLQRA